MRLVLALLALLALLANPMAASAFGQACEHHSPAAMAAMPDVAANPAQDVSRLDPSCDHSRSEHSVPKKSASARLHPCMGPCCAVAAFPDAPSLRMVATTGVRRASWRLLALHGIEPLGLIRPPRRIA